PIADHWPPGTRTHRRVATSCPLYEPAATTSTDMEWLPQAVMAECLNPSPPALLAEACETGPARVLSAATAAIEPIVLTFPANICLPPVSGVSSGLTLRDEDPGGRLKGC